MVVKNFCAMSVELWVIKEEFRSQEPGLRIEFCTTGG